MADETSTYSSRSLSTIDHKDDLNKLEAACNHWYKQCEMEKWPRAFSWFTNACFLQGNQYPAMRYTNGQIVADTDGNPQIATRSFTVNIPKVKSNQLIPPVQTNVSLLTELKPIPRVTPNSAAPEDEDAAKLSEVVFDLLWERPLNMPDRLAQMAHEICVNGTSFIEIIYGETDTPEEVVKYKTVEIENPLFPDGKSTKYVPTDQTDTVPKKDIQAKVFSAYNICINPEATDDPDTLKWIMRSTYEDIDWIKETFDKKDEGFYPENLSAMSQQQGYATPLYYFTRCRDILENPSELSQFLASTTTQWNYAPGPNMTVFTVIDVKPSMAHPKGRTIIIGGGKIIYCGDARAYNVKYPFRWHPYSIAKFWRKPGQFWGMPLLAPLVVLQKQLNAIDSLYQYYRENAGIGHWLIPESAGIKEGYITNLPGQQIKYKVSQFGYKPERVPMPPLPANYPQERQMVITAINEISGVNKVLSGENPTGSRSSLMLDFLKKETVRSKAVVLQQFERTLESIAQSILIEVSANFNAGDSEMTRRLQEATKDTSSLSVKNFTGMDLRDNIHVKIDLTNELMKTPEAKADRAEKFLQFNPNLRPNERVLVAKAMGLEEFSETDTPQVNKARRMISFITSGILEATGLAIPGVDNPGIFAEQFRYEIISDRFIDYAPEIKQALLATFDMYQKLAQQEMQNAMMQQAMAQQAASNPAKVPTGPPPASS